MSSITTLQHSLEYLAWKLQTAWEGTSWSYNSKYLPFVRKTADDWPNVYTVGYFGWDSRLTTPGFVESSAAKQLRAEAKKRGWFAITGAGPRDMFNETHIPLRLDGFGSTCHTYIFNDVADTYTLIELFFVLQMSQKLRVAKTLGKHREFEYFFSRLSREHAWQPRAILVGEIWKPFEQLMKRFREEGCIHEEDLRFVKRVDTLEEAYAEAEKDNEQWRAMCDEHGEHIVTSASSVPLDQLEQIWKRARYCYEHLYLPAMCNFADELELRGRGAMYGSHLTAGKGSADAGAWMAKHLFDIILGGGPKEMLEMAVGAKAGNGNSAGLIEAIKTLVYAMSLTLPDEQLRPGPLDMSFVSNHFFPRLHGFSALATAHYMRAKGGFGTGFEGAYSLGKSARARQAVARGEPVGDTSLMNRLVRHHGWTPHTFGVGPLWRLFEAQVHAFRDAGYVDAEDVALLRIFDTQDEAFDAIWANHLDLREFCETKGVVLLN